MNVVNRNLNKAHHLFKHWRMFYVKKNNIVKLYIPTFKVVSLLGLLNLIPRVSVLAVYTVINIIHFNKSRRD